MPGGQGSRCMGNPWGNLPGRRPLPHPIPAAPFPRGGRIICFPCCPDLWATLFFIYLHKLRKVTRSLPEVRDSVNTSGSQVSRPAQGGRGYRRSPGNGRWTPVLLRLRGSALGRTKQTGEAIAPEHLLCAGSQLGPSLTHVPTTVLIEDNQHFYQSGN